MLEQIENDIINILDSVKENDGFKTNQVQLMILRLPFSLDSLFLL